MMRRSALTLVGRHRSFVGGAFATEFDEIRAKARRSRLRSFLASLEQLPTGSCEGSVQVEVQRLVHAELSEHAPAGAFHSREQLRVAVDAARARLSELQTESLKLEIKPSSGAETSASPAAAAMAAAQPASPPQRVEDEDAPPDELTQPQQDTLVSLRAACALSVLPNLWERLPRTESGSGSTSAAVQASPASGVKETAGMPPLPLGVVVDAAETLVRADPWATVRFHAEVGGGEEARIEQLRVAAAATAEASFAWTREILLRTELLDESEQERLSSLSDGASATVTAELRRRTMMQKLWHRISPTRAVGADSDHAEGGSGARVDRDSNEAISAIDRADAALFDAMRNDVALQSGMTAALFSYHDRLSTRRRRQINAVKYTGLFISLNILDFILTNV